MKYLFKIKRPVAHESATIIEVMDHSPLNFEEAEITVSTEGVFTYDEDIYCKSPEEVKASFETIGCEVEYEPIEL